MSEQAIYGDTAYYGVELINRSGNGALPVGEYDFAEAMDRCVLVDKTMFIADVLDADASVVACCRPEGFGKSMNLSMLKAFLERPADGRAGQSLFADTQIWDADGGRYRDEFARYPVISLDFSDAARRGAAVASVVRDALSRECARLLPLLEAPDLPRDKMRHIERVARGVASADEVNSVLGVLIELLEMACDEQVVLLVDGYDAAWLGSAGARDAFGADPAELFDRVLFDAIAAAGDSLWLACLMGSVPVLLWSRSLRAGVRAACRRRSQRGVTGGLAFRTKRFRLCLAMLDARNTWMMRVNGSRDTDLAGFIARVRRA